ncbi:MAG: AEC family transporter [Candidatus Promineifilaceae bacterium]
MQIINTIFPVFAIAITGYVTARVGLFNESDIRGLSRFVFNLAIPVLLFNALSSLELPPHINWQFLLSYYLVVFLIYGLSVWLGRSRFTLTPRQQGVFGIGATYSNLGLVGLPIITIGLGDRAILPLFTIISVHAGILWFLGTIVTERTDNADDNDGRSRHIKILLTGWHSVQNLARNPIIIGLILGLAFNRLPHLLPQLVKDTLELFGQTSLPCALFVLGGSLAVFRPQADNSVHQVAKGTMNDEFIEAAVLVCLKLLIHPLLVWVLASQVFHLDPLWVAVAVMAAGMPTGVNAYMFAQKYQECLRVMGTAVLFSTLLAAGTQSILLVIFMHS